MASSTHVEILETISAFQAFALMNLSIIIVTAVEPDIFSHPQNYRFTINLDVEVKGHVEKYVMNALQK